MSRSVLIVEDYPAAARRLAQLVREQLGDELKTLATVGSLPEARLLLASSPPEMDPSDPLPASIPVDLLLLDLDLNGADGFDLLEAAVAEPFHTIIVSAHVDRAVEAFELGVLDFVPKPVDPDRLGLALDRFRGMAGRDSVARSLVVRSHQRRRIVAVSQIRWIQGAGKYSALHLNDETSPLHGKSLDRLEQLLAPDWFRIHRSYLVPLRAIQRLEVLGGGRYRAHLAGGELLPVGRSRYPELLALYETDAARGS